MSSRRSLFYCVVLLIVTIVRIVATYTRTSQGFDEPCHVAAAIELLDRHTYKLDPVHPPLARIAIGLPLYLAGERYPHLSQNELARPNYNVVGDHILYDSGHYLRNLVLARTAMLPFLVALSVIVFLWTRQEFGRSTAVIAVLLLTTTPTVLAFSSIAYTDLVTATTQVFAIFMFTRWLENPSRLSTVLLGVAIGFAVTSKMTTFIFLPSAAAAIVALRWYQLRKGKVSSPRIAWARLGGAILIGTILLWGSYGFSFGHVREEFGLSVDSMPSFQHFPAPVANLARRMVVNDWLIPAPAFFHGVAEIWVLNKEAGTTYMLGVRDSCWYFFLLGLLFKVPLPMLVLFGIGAVTLVRGVHRRHWRALVPLVAMAAVLIVTLPVKYHAGMRHVLVVFPFMAVVAGVGAVTLWNLGTRRWWVRLALGLLIAWQGFETVRSQQDFLAYFNELAGHDPSRVMVTGCDLDCGQDIFRLSDELHARGISHFTLAVWSSADMNRMGLPAFDVLDTSGDVSGWVAISARSQRIGDVLHKSYSPEAFQWLNEYQPVTTVGKTIRLYYLPKPVAACCR